jgi:two-component system, NtrC family, nitrogen regulation sensor histidine kinase NtrY
VVSFVYDYMDYTNIPQPVPSFFSILELLDNICVLLKEEMVQAGIHLKVEVTPSNLNVYADQDLIQMILINLVKNAKEAMGNTFNRTIILKAGVNKQSFPFIQVIDHGEGIVPEAMERIFVPFYTTKKTGSGIGLAISRQIMNLHKGSLGVESVVGERTVFTLDFG